MIDETVADENCRQGVMEKMKAYMKKVVGDLGQKIEVMAE